eukprot:6232139-Amphidinium_carterae.1
MPGASTLVEDVLRDGQDRHAFAGTQRQTVGKQQITIVRKKNQIVFIVLVLETISEKERQFPGLFPQ